MDMGTLNIKGNGVGDHRVAYELYVGNITKGLHVLHKCDIRSCVNPEHLFIGTNIDNINDCIKKGRWRTYTSRIKDLNEKLQGPTNENQKG